MTLLGSPSMPVDERGGPAVEGERAGDGERLAGGHVGVDLGVGGSPKRTRVAATPSDPAGAGGVDHAVAGVAGCRPCPRMRCQRRTASSGDGGLPWRHPRTRARESQPTTRPPPPPPPPAPVAAGGGRRLPCARPAPARCRRATGRRRRPRPPRSPGPRDRTRPCAAGGGGRGGEASTSRRSGPMGAGSPSCHDRVRPRRGAAGSWPEPTRPGRRAGRRMTSRDGASYGTEVSGPEAGATSGLLGNAHAGSEADHERPDRCTRCRPCPQ